MGLCFGYVSDMKFVPAIEFGEQVGVSNSYRSGSFVRLLLDLVIQMKRPIVLLYQSNIRMKLSVDIMCECERIANQ